MRIITIETQGGKDLIIDFISKLPKQEKAKAINILKKLKIEGTKALEILNTRQLYKNIWEIKFYRYNRFLYVLIDEENCYILHAFKKQKNRTEKIDLDIAKERAKILGLIK